MPVKSTMPTMTLIDSATGKTLSRHNSDLEAMEKATHLPNGEYDLDRPTGKFVVTESPFPPLTDDTPAEPEPPADDPVEEQKPLVADIIIKDPSSESLSSYKIHNGETVNISYRDAQHMSILVYTSKGPVTFDNGTRIHTENSAPFMLAGDHNYISLEAGLHTIDIATPDSYYQAHITVAEPVSSEPPADPEPQPEPEPTDPEPTDDLPTKLVPYTHPTYAPNAQQQDEIDHIKAQFNFLPRDENGWTIINPNSEHLAAYVDAEKGNDTTAQLIPQGTAPEDSQLFKTFPAALAAMPTTNTNGELKSGAHHIFLRDDQTFNTTDQNHTRLPSGEDYDNRFVIGRYGNGTKPPLVDDFGLFDIRFWGVCRYFIFQGVDLYNKYRDPNNPEFVGWGNTGKPIKSGIQFYAAEIGSSHVLIEGSNMNFISPKFSGKGHSQIIAHRCVITNTYSEETHQQGWYGGGAREIMFDECIFDHDGWFKQREKEIKLNTKAEGRATYFNHNMYLSNIKYLWLRNPIFLRASSIGTKLTSNGEKGAEVDSITSSYILIENPYYLEGETGISAGGNTDHNSGPRWMHMYTINPVFEAIGRSQPTNRTLGWGYDIQDWDTGAVFNPLFIGCDNDNVTNTYALNIIGHCRSVKLYGTIAYNIGAKDKPTGAYVVRYREQGQSDMQGIEEIGSIIQNPDSKCKLLSDDVVDGITRRNCLYYSNNENKNELFKLDETYLSIEEAMAHPSMQDCMFVEVVFHDTTRSAQTYMASLGLEPTVEAFAAECGKQNILNWRPEFTAQAITQYLREGFTPTGLRVPDAGGAA